MPNPLNNILTVQGIANHFGQRATTAVPTQALFLMNSPVVKEHAAALAARMQEEAADDSQRLQVLWLTLLNRPITGPEESESTSFLTAAGDGAWTELCHALLASNEFLMRM